MKKYTKEEAIRIYNFLYPNDKVMPGNPSVPSRPDVFYSLTGEWTSWCDFLGNDNIENIKADDTFNIIKEYVI